MLVAAHFLVLNLPKSGSSFVRAVVKDLYRRRRGRYPAWWPHRSGSDRFLKELILPNVRLPGRSRDQHGIAAQIPRRFRDRPIVSVIRDPYAKLVSDYRFRWWATYPPLPPAELARLFPQFPGLSFDEYLRLSDHVAARKVVATTGAGPSTALGNLTVEFVQFFFRDPATALRRMSDDYVASGAFRADMAPVAFLRQERLNEELADFLARHGFAAAEVTSARAHAAVNVTDGAPGAVAWSAWGLAHVADRERHLLAMLAMLGFHYPPPATAA